MMTRREAGRALLSAAALAATPIAVAAGDVPAVALPKPGSGGSPLLEALRLRRSTRDYSSRPLPPQTLSDLLWSAYGINRPESGDRTAPSWRHFIAIGIYVAMADGVWRYEPKPHRLVKHMDGDLRARTGTQDFVGVAPVNLVYVADGARMGDATVDDKRLYAFTDTGFIGQNVYLFCASAGLATVVRGAVDRDRLEKILQLGKTQFVTLAQTVGYPRS
jgi:nitroreductase